MYGRAANETASQSSGAAQLYPYHQQAFQRYPVQPNPAVHYADHVEHSWSPPTSGPRPPSQPPVRPNLSYYHPVATGPRRFSSATQPLSTYESPQTSHYTGPSSVPVNPARYTSSGPPPLPAHIYGGSSQSQFIPYHNEVHASPSQLPDSYPSSSEQRNQSYSGGLPSVPYANPSRQSVPQVNNSYFPPHRMTIPTYPTQQSSSYAATAPRHSPPYVNSEPSVLPTPSSHPIPPRPPMSRPFVPYNNAHSAPRPSVPHAGPLAVQPDSYETVAGSMGLNPLPAPVPQKADAPVHSDGASTDDEAEMAKAITMSQIEMAQKREEEMQRSNQEEADLAKALEESLLTNTHLFGGESSTPRSAPSQSKGKSREFPQLPVNVPSSDTFQMPHGSAASKTTTLYEDELEFVLGNHKKWHIPAVSGISQEGTPNGVTLRAGSPSSVVAGPSSSTPPHASTHSSTTSLPQVFRTLERSDSLQQYGQQSNTPDQLSSSLAALESFQQTETAESRLVFDDEAYARQLAAEEEEELRNRFERKARIESERQQPEPEKLPQYTTEGLLAPDLQSDDSHSIQSSSSLPVASPPLHAQPAQAMVSAPRPATSFEGAQQQSPFQFRSEQYQGQPPAPRPATSIEAAQQSPPQFRGEPYQGQPYDSRPPLQTVQPNPTTSTSGQSFSEPLPGRTDKPHSNLNPLRPAAYHASTFPTAAVGSSNGAQLNHISSTGLLNPNHFVDRELVMGVSVGFKPPVVSNNLVPMKDPMPNIITLPATRCPPLHLQAPDWRHMLRLLARLSNTRIEPTVEALSASKTPLKLRTVVQFIKPHPLSSTWRTILWFTIDHAVPSNVAGAQRYLSGNPNILPWSYTLSPVPMLLRDATDTPLSKTYTIPVTEAVPLPELPITFPNLFIYLHVILEQSRKYSRSSDAGGLGKLGKMVETCYPNVREEDYEDDMPGRSSAVSEWFRRFIGRGHRDRNRGGTSNNNEIYQMVIPFTSDEWS